MNFFAVLLENARRFNEASAGFFVRKGGRRVMLIVVTGNSRNVVVLLLLLQLLHLLLLHLKLLHLKLLGQVVSLDGASLLLHGRGRWGRVWLEAAVHLCLCLLYLISLNL